MITSRLNHPWQLVPWALALAFASAWLPASAAIVVNSTAGRGLLPGRTTCDTGSLNAAGAAECTLIAAIAVANLTSATRDDILFDIPAGDPGYNSAGGWWTIGSVGGQLSIGTPVTIDGYTQPGAQPNTLPVGSDASLKIQILTTLYVYANDCEIRGLALVQLRLLGAQRAVVSGNFIGTNPSGTAAQVPASLQAGILVTSNTTSSPGASDSLIGGPNPEDRNVISGGGQGILEQIYLPNPPTRNVYENNYIGLDAAGEVQIRNVFEGINLGGYSETVRGNVISGSGNGVVINDSTRDATIEDNRIGTSADGTKDLGNAYLGINVSLYPNHGVHRIRRNRIAHNGTGIQVSAGVMREGAEILSNEIFDNDELGIDIVPYGSPADRFNLPNVTAVDADGIRNTYIFGEVNLAPFTPYTVQIFANEACEPAYGYGEGQLLFASGSVDTDANGFASFTIIAPPLSSIYHDITATATDEVTHSTTEFSGCQFAAIQPQFDVVKTHAPEPVAVDGLLTYTIVAASRLPQELLGVGFEDDLPAGVTFLSATASQGFCSEADGTVTCALGDVPAFGTVEVEIRVRPDAVGTLVNRARVGNSTSDDDIAEVVLVPPDAMADFAVEFAGTPADLNPGAGFDFVLTARNLGPDPAAAEIEFHLPPGASAVRPDPSASSGSYNLATGIWTTDILTPDPTGVLGARLVVHAVVDTEAPGCIDAEARVRPADPGTTDSNPANDSPSIRLGAGGCADIQALIRVGDACFSIFGDEVTFQGVVKNHGPNTALGVVGTWTIVEEDGDCNGREPDCHVMEHDCTASAPCELAPGESATFVVEEQDCGRGPFERHLAVTSPVGDPEPSNNEVSARFVQNALSCFIATAAWGSPFDPHVQTLRNFRDRHLVTNPLGRGFVSAYYRISPPLAEVIAARPVLRAAVRTALMPIVLAVEFPGAAAAVALISAGAIAGLVYTRRRRREAGSRLARRVVIATVLALTAAVALAGERGTATSDVAVKGASLADLAPGADLIVLGTVESVARVRSGGDDVSLRVEKFLEGGHASETILVRVTPSRLRPGDRVLLLLVPALPGAPDAGPGRVAGRLALVEPGRYLILSPRLSREGEESLKRWVRVASRRPDVAAPVQSGASSLADRSRALARIRAILAADPSLLRDAWQAHADLLRGIDRQPGSFRFDAAMVARLRDLAERLAVEAPPEVRALLAKVIGEIERFEGVPLDQAQVSRLRTLLAGARGWLSAGGR